MTVDKRPSLRKAIDQHCKCCIHDPQAAGTWRQQVTLCSVTGCALYPVRPFTESPIPDTTLDYYGVTGPERIIFGCSRPPEGPIAKGNESDGR